MDEAGDIELKDALARGQVSEIVAWLDGRAPHDIAEEFTRLDAVESALVWRLLGRDRALEVFEELDARAQQQLLNGMRDQAFRETLESMDPDDRARMLGEAPATFVHRVLQGLSTRERAMTASLLGFPEGSVGRVMSPEVVTVHADTPVPEILNVVKRKGIDAETIDILAVVDRERKMLGVMDLSHVVMADDTLTAGDLADRGAPSIAVTENAERAARLVQETNRLGLLVVDSEDRVLGVLTVDDALELIEKADTEDVARQAATLPSSGHYLSASPIRLAGLRVVWLLILIVAATLTVSVLQLFESSLEAVTALALFIPLLVGTGGNVGAQAATSAVRALAIGEVRPSDALRVAWRESRVGLVLGLALGGLALAAGWIVAGIGVGITVGVSVVLVCIWAATVGSLMPLMAKTLNIDPAVISAPLVTTLVDATGLVIYFVVAGLVLGL
ncbi:MAG: magnesium transporter [Microbacteriaceae bacterium BACL25 MAG-120322-bin65]|jgi:magnesium transporter|nr:MAG: magnesium transporter [Microbacteriaceae bacterium BACL25 MAG-120322-bin65]HAA79197.1 magnesium transporter [Microbacteriaceae bacterium]